MTVFIQKERMYVAYILSLVALYFFTSFMYYSETPEPSRYLKYLYEDFNDLAWVIHNIITAIGSASFIITIGAYRALFPKNSELISLKDGILYIPKRLSTKISKVPVKTISNIEMNQHDMRIYCRTKGGEISFSIPRLLGKDLPAFYENLKQIVELREDEPKADRYAVLLDTKKVSDIFPIIPVLKKLTKRDDKQLLDEYQSGRVILFRNLEKDNAVKVRSKLSNLNIPITFIKEAENTSSVEQYYTPETPHYMMPTACLIGASLLGIDIVILVLIYLLYLFKHYKIEFELMQLPLSAILLNAVLTAFMPDIEEPLSFLVYIMFMLAISAYIGLSLKKQLELKLKNFSANTFFVVLFGEIAINYYVNRHIFDDTHNSEDKVSALNAT